MVEASGRNNPKNEIVVVVSTDKVDVEVESMVEGTLSEIIVGPRSTVPVRTVLATVKGSGPTTD